MRLQGKVAIVTGSGAGIGKAIAIKFAQEGATVIVATRREDNGQPVVDEIKKNGGQALFVKCDISSEHDVKVMVEETLNAYGRIDILVNNAGVYIEKDFINITPEIWDRIVDVDLRGTYLCTWYCVPHMLKNRNGSVINIASNHTLASLPGAAPYAAAKWGMVGFTKSLAVELTEQGVRVNVLSPGLIETPMAEEVRKASNDEEQFMSFWRANIPARRLGEPEEIANVAVFLASDESSYVTGINLVADGGTSSQLTSRASFDADDFDGQDRE